MAKSSHYVAAESFVVADGTAYTKNQSIVAANDPILKGKGIMKLFRPVSEASHPRRTFREPADLDPTFTGDEPPQPPEEKPKARKRASSRKKTAARKRPAAKRTAAKAAPKAEAPAAASAPAPRPAGLTTANVPTTGTMTSTTG